MTMQKKYLTHARTVSDIGDDYLIYHYTSRDVFVKIMEEGLWATHTDFLNDDTEITHGNALAKNIFKSLHLDDHLRVLQENLNALDVYVTCFSREDDSLYQWKAYTPRGGFAIAFSRKELFSEINKFALSEENISKKQLNVKRAFAIHEDISSRDYLFFFLEKCIYSSERICAEIVEQIKNRYIQSPESFITECREILEKHGILNVMDNFATVPTMKLLCSIAKNKTFDIENEERLICIGNRTLRKNIELIGNKPRIKIPAQAENLRNLIKRVIVSPHGDRKRNKLFAEIFRDKHDLNFEISDSMSSSNGE